MENNNAQKNQMPVINDPSEQKTPLQPGLSKEERVKKQKKSFFRKVKLFLILVAGFLGLLIAGFIANRVYTETKDRFVVNEEYTGEGTEIVKVTEPEGEPDKKEIYANDKYRFSFEYMQKDPIAVIDEQNQALKIKITSKDILPTKDPDGFNLVKGYIFEISPISIYSRDVKKVAEVKRTWFDGQCEGKYNIGGTYNTKVYGYDSVRFEVTNCNSDFIVTYVPANNVIYEIIQTFKGDLGYKQSYKLQTNLMTDSIKINEAEKDESPYLVYENRMAGIKFEYDKNLDTNCCDAPSIEFDSQIQNAITFSTGSNENTLGVSFATFRYSVDFEEVLTKLENFLIDDYRLIKGREPQGTKTEMTISNRRAIKFTNYSWKGNEIIIFEPVGRSKTVIVFSIYNMPEEYTEHILNSMTSL